MKKKPIFSVAYFVSVLLGFFLLQLLFFSGTRNVEISYNEFKDNLQNGSIEKVVILEKQIFGSNKSATDNDESDDWDLKKEENTPWNIFAKKDDAAKSFFVIRLEDRELINDLQSAGVEYRGKLEDNWFSNCY